MEILFAVLVVASVLSAVQPKGTYEGFKKKHTHNEAQGVLQCTNFMKNINPVNVRCRPFNSVIIIPRNSVALNNVIKVCRGEGTNVNLPNEENEFRGNYYKSTKQFKVSDCVLTSPVNTPSANCVYNENPSRDRYITVACESKAPNDVEGRFRKPVHFERHDP